MPEVGLCYMCGCEDHAADSPDCPSSTLGGLLATSAVADALLALGRVVAHPVQMWSACGSPLTSRVLSPLIVPVPGPAGRAA